MCVYVWWEMAKGLYMIFKSVLATGHCFSSTFFASHFPSSNCFDFCFMESILVIKYGDVGIYFSLG